MPAMMHSAYARIGIGPRYHTPRSGLGMSAQDGGGHGATVARGGSPGPGRAPAIRRPAAHPRQARGSAGVGARMPRPGRAAGVRRPVSAATLGARGRPRRVRPPARGRRGPACSAAVTNAEPTITPSANAATSAAWSPRPHAEPDADRQRRCARGSGRRAAARRSRTASRAPVTPMIDGGVDEPAAWPRRSWRSARRSRTARPGRSGRGRARRRRRATRRPRPGSGPG